MRAKHFKQHNEQRLYCDKYNKNIFQNNHHDPPSIEKGLVLLEWKYFPTPKILDPQKLINTVIINLLL
ncbi:hypothetical protein LS451_03005 [Fructilactobacillus sanfranciscensis]|nr:hypothetical protein LS451_03005 [Fructilactobacillus sanfranciscensis]RDX59531.1 hypothetical protein DXM13_03180 [Fructilactobacillus sanfranciscensis]